MRQALAFIPLSGGTKLVNHPWTVKGSRGSNRYHFRRVGGGPSIYLAVPVSWMLPPSTTPLSAAGRSNLLTQSLNLSRHGTHATCPTQMNRAPERIYSKPMVDG